MKLSRILELLQEAALESIKENIDCKFTQCLLGLCQMGQFKPEYLDNAFPEAEKILKETSNRSVIKGAIIILMFRLEKHMRQLDATPDYHKGKKQALTLSASQIRHQTHQVFKQTSDRMNRRLDEECRFLLKIGRELTSAQLTLSNGLFSFLVLEAAQWFGLAYDFLTNNLQYSMATSAEKLQD